MTTTLIVQTPGLPVSNANTYLDVSASDVLAAKYGMTVWVNEVVKDKSTPLFLAAQYLEQTYGTEFSGCISTNTQSMSFPRTKFYTTNGQLVEQGVIPEVLQVAQLQLALLVLTGTDLNAPPSAAGNLKQLTETVDGGVNRTQIWFGPNQANYSPSYQVGTILSPILNSASSRNRTYRA